MPSSHGAVPHSLCSPYSADCDHRPAPSLSAGECSNNHDSFPHPAPNQQHTHTWLLRLTDGNSDHPVLTFRTSLSEFFPQLRRCSFLYWIAETDCIFQRWPQWSLPFYMISRRDSDPDTPHIKCWAFSLILTSWTQADTCDDLRQQNVVWWRSILSDTDHHPTRFFCLTFSGFSFLEYTSCAVHEPKSLTETPPTHQVKNSWCLFNMLTSFSNFLKLKIFLYTSRD